MPQIQLISHSPDETAAIGRAMAPLMAKNSFIALRGPLGAGKTRFVQGLAEGLTCGEKARSPSYTLINEYHGRLKVYHCDWYRLTSDDDIASTGFEDLPASGGLIVVEWPERGPSWLPDERWEVSIEHLKDASRNDADESQNNTDDSRNISIDGPDADALAAIWTSLNDIENK